MKILVIAAHPDDETLGMGGTIKKLSKQNEVRLCVITDGASAQYADKSMIQVRKDACVKALKILGVTKIYFLDLPDMRLDSIPHIEINIKLEKVINDFKPDTVYTTPHNDLNRDHLEVFESTLIAARPHSSSVKNIFSYELPGVKKTSFCPNHYENIRRELRYKIKAFKCYKSEIENFPHPRSTKAIENLSILRGVESSMKNAEAFCIIRSINE